MTPLSLIAGKRWLPCLTADTASVLGAFFLLSAVDVGVDSDGNLTVTIADEDDDPRELYANSFQQLDYHEVAGGTRGNCTKDWPAWVQYDTDDGTPAVGEEWGPTTDGIGLGVLHSDGEGFLIVGGTLEIDDGSGGMAVWVLPKHCAF